MLQNHVKSTKLSANYALLVEDSKEYSEKVVSYLENDDFEVDAALDFKSGLQVGQDAFWSYGLAIIDQNLGGDKPTGGQLLSKVAKTSNPIMFVVLYTGIREVKINENVIDLVVKKKSLKEDMQYIFAEYAKYVRKNFKISIDHDHINAHKENMSFVDDMNNPDTENQRLFNELIADKQWFEKHKGKYVAIVDGHIAGESDDERLLVTSIAKSSDGEILISKVEQKDAIQLVSPFCQPF